MDARVSPADYPWYVKVARIGARTRRAQWAWFWFTIALTGVAVVFLLMRGLPYVIGLIFLLSSLVNWLAIRWMDRHGDWDAR